MRQIDSFDDPTVEYYEETDDDILLTTPAGLS